MGLELINHLGPLKMPLLGHRLSLSVEQLRELSFPSPVSESAYVRVATACTALQEHDVQELPQPHCFPHKRSSSPADCSAAAADQQPPNPSHQLRWWPPDGG